VTAKGSGLDWPSVTAGGLISYGPDLIDQVPPRGRLRRPHPQARKPADLPVQAPTTYELVINRFGPTEISLTAQ
jgi:putative tryptophan/tyrosine transport system substrate-binding protein